MTQLIKIEKAYINPDAIAVILESDEGGSVVWLKGNDERFITSEQLPDVLYRQLFPVG